MTVKNRIVIAFLSFLFFYQANSFAQIPITTKDTAYVLLLLGSMDDGRPISSEIVVSRFNNIKVLSAFENRDSFLCRLFANSVIFEEPNLTLTKNINLYGFKNDLSIDSFKMAMSKQIGKLNGGFKLIGTRRFKTGSEIAFHGMRIIADFWKTPAKNTDELNFYNHSFYVEMNCYKKQFIYNIKSIEEVSKITNAELLELKNAIGL